MTEVFDPGFGGMVSFRHPAATRIAAARGIFSSAESLGGVESRIEVPQAMTHQSVEGPCGSVPPDLVRRSCGSRPARTSSRTSGRRSARPIDGPAEPRAMRRLTRTSAAASRP